MFQGASGATGGEWRHDVVTPGPSAESRAASGVEEGLASAALALLERRDALLAEVTAGLPGPALAQVLSEIEVADVEDATLLESIAAWDRLASWAASRQAVAINELRRRRTAGRRERFVGDEVAARLGATRATGELKVAHAAGLEKVPVVWDALDAGRIDLRKATVLCDELLALPSPLRFDVAAAVVREADVLTVPQLRARIRKAALAADPDAAARAHERERAARHVQVDPVRDGMAWLHAYLPAPAAIAVHTALTAIADAQPTGDPRPMDARRADALVDVVTRWLDAGTTPDGTPLPTHHRRRPHLQVTADLRTLLGLDDTVAELQGYGPVHPDVARAIAAAAGTWTPVLTDAGTGEVVKVGPVLREPLPVAGVPPADGAARERPSGDRASARAPAERPGPEPPGTSPRTRRRRGGGPGAVGYRPPAEVVEAVLARDRTCTFPGCRTPAERCDIDHVVPYDPDLPGWLQTVESNLHALCRHHHLAKTHGGWRVRRDDPTGATHWTAPTGHTYVRAAATSAPMREGSGEGVDTPPDSGPRTMSDAPTDAAPPF